MRLFGLVIITGLLGTLFAVGQRSPVNMIAAIVNNSVITRHEVEMSAMQGMVSVRRIYRNNPAVLEREALKVMEESLELLVERQLILNDYRTSGMQMPEAVIEDELKRQIREKYGNRANLTKELQAQGMTFEDYRQKIRENFITYAMRQHHVRTAIIISPAKIKRYFQNHATNYSVGDEVKLRILVMTANDPDESPLLRKLLLEVDQKIEAGTSFSEMASVYSEGNRPGGDWGWCERSYLHKGLSDIAFNMEPGQRSNLIGRRREVESENSFQMYFYDKQGIPRKVRKYGPNEATGETTLIEELDVDAAAAAELLEPQEYYLILVEEKRSARTKSLAEVQDEIETELRRAETERLRKKWIDRLRNKSFVRYF